MITTDKIQGCFWAHALGDAMGMPVEFNQIEMIKEGYGENGIQEPKEWAIWTDDTEMALAVTRALIKLGTVEQIVQFEADELGTAFAAEFINWYDNMGHAPGMTCKASVHHLIKNGSSSWHEAGDNDSKGCGSAMRAYPLGIWFTDAIAPELKVGKGPVHDLLVKVSQIQSEMTHGHKAATAGALASAYSVCLAVNGMTPSEMIDIVKEFCAGIHPDFDEVIEILQWTLEKRANGEIESDLDAMHHIGGGWVGEEAFAMALYAAIRFTDDLKGCLRVAVNHDGDSDSVGCIAGSILGAFHGMSIVPSNWIDRLTEKKRMEDMIARVLEVLKI
jgi:ADP-ribosylglycohydrolase